MLKTRYATASGRNTESYDVFIERALEILVPDGTLAFVPVEEMEKIRENKFTQREIQVTEKPQQLKAGDGISFEMKFTLDLEETDADRVELKLRCGKEKDPRCIFDLKNGELLVDRSCADGWSAVCVAAWLQASWNGF